MSKKGKRLREFEKNNKTFSVRESRKKAAAPGSDSEPARENIKKRKRIVINARSLAATVVVLLFVVLVGASAFKLIKLTIEKNDLEQRQEELNLEKEELSAELEHVDSAEYIEQQVRESLRLIKKNEILFILSEQAAGKNNEETAGEDDANAEEGDSQGEEDGQAEN